MNPVGSSHSSILFVCLLIPLNRSLVMAFILIVLHFPHLYYFNFPGMLRYFYFMPEGSGFESQGHWILEMT
jgi:hypothetical protein